MVATHADNLSSGTMIVTCASCGTKYRVPAAEIPAAGRRVKCVHCQEVWVQHRQPGVTESPTAAPVARPTPSAAGVRPAPDGPRPPTPAAPAEDRFSVWFWRCFLVLAVGVVATAVYVFAAEIAAFIPATEPWLDEYIDWVETAIRAVGEWFS